MARTLRSRSSRPHSAARDLEARFAVLDHFHTLGLASELVEHVLFGPESGLNLCTCLRCRFYEGQDDR
jgi:hypothetical protein